MIGFSGESFGRSGSAWDDVAQFKHQIALSGKVEGMAEPRAPGGRYTSLLEPPPPTLEIDEVVVDRLRDAGVAL
jgi:hypothetical protein